MKYSIFLMLFLAGCCTTKDSTFSSVRDTTIHYQPPPVNIDSLTALLSFQHNPNCDTASIIARYGSLLFFWQDSVGQYRAWLTYERMGRDSLAQRLRFLENRAPQEKVITVATNWISTQVQSIPLLHKLGLIFVGFLFCLGVIVGIKAFL